MRRRQRWNPTVLTFLVVLAGCAGLPIRSAPTPTAFDSPQWGPRVDPSWGAPRASIVPRTHTDPSPLSVRLPTPIGDRLVVEHLPPREWAGTVPFVTQETVRLWKMWQELDALSSPRKERPRPYRRPI